MLYVGVAGAGVFGGYHAGKYAALSGVRLAAVFDHDLGKARTLAAGFGAEAFDTYAAFLAAVEAVTVATPADTHAELAQAALEAGRHTYVEKPLAAFPGDAKALVATAQARGLVLACGHQERVVFRAMGLMDAPEQPRRIEAVRRGPPSPRNRDVSCVLDLMIHDLDLALALGGEAASVKAEGGFDEAVAEVVFTSGMTARFETSRVAPARERTMRLTYPSGVVEIDFLAPAFANHAGFPLNADFAETPEGRDPLGTSVAAFVAAIQNRAAHPAASGVDGARALELAVKVELALDV